MFTYTKAPLQKGGSTEPLSRSATVSPDLADMKLPRAWPKTVEAKLYPVDIVEEEEDRVKVHYIGYDSAHDEWKNREELETLNDGGHELEL